MAQCFSRGFWTPTAPNSNSRESNALLASIDTSHTCDTNMKAKPLYALKQQPTYLFMTLFSQSWFTLTKYYNSALYRNTGTIDFWSLSSDGYYLVTCTSNSSSEVLRPTTACARVTLDSEISKFLQKVKGTWIGVWGQPGWSIHPGMEVTQRNSISILNPPKTAKENINQMLEGTMSVSILLKNSSWPNKV